jgi:hypothetical protein
MVIKWKTFLDSLPYICTICGDFSNSEREYCEKCGRKDSLRKTTRQDYENHIKKISVEAPQLQGNKKKVRITKRAKMKKTAIMISIIFCAFLIIDLIAFLILIDILGISSNQIGDYLPLLLGLLGFSLVMFIIIVIGIYVTYYGGLYWPF